MYQHIGYYSFACFWYFEQWISLVAISAACERWMGCSELLAWCHACKIVRGGWKLPTTTATTGPCRPHCLAAVQCETAALCTAIGSNSGWHPSRRIGNSLWESISGSRYVKRYGILFGFGGHCFIVWLQLRMLVVTRRYATDVWVKKGECFWQNYWYCSERGRRARPNYWSFASGND